MRMIVLGLLTLAGCAQPPPANVVWLPPPNASIAPAPRTPVVWTVQNPSTAEVRLVETSVSRSLRDPESARFEAITRLSGSNGRTYFCGRVNAKNAYGGYVGFTQFQFDPPSRIIMATDRVMGPLFPALCEARTIN